MIENATELFDNYQKQFTAEKLNNKISKELNMLKTKVQYSEAINDES